MRLSLHWACAEASFEHRHLRTHRSQGATSPLVTHGSRLLLVEQPLQNCLCLPRINQGCCFVFIVSKGLTLHLLDALGYLLHNIGNEISTYNWNYQSRADIAYTMGSSRYQKRASICTRDSISHTDYCMLLRLKSKLCGSFPILAFNYIDPLKHKVNHSMLNANMFLL